MARYESDNELNNSLQLIRQAVIDYWPEHERYIDNSLGSLTPEEFSDVSHLAELLGRVFGGGLNQLVSDYKWTCDSILEEELFFRREGRYRCNSISDLESRVYSQPEIMRPYINGLALSQVFWANHAKVFSYYRRQFLTRSTSNWHVEVGPGHGFWLYYVAIDANCKALGALDISASSLAMAEGNLKELGIAREVRMLQGDISRELALTDFYPDRLVISEVLEHLERPDVALRNIAYSLADGGEIFVNVPVNSPALDHIYLFTTPEAVLDLISSAGLEVVEYRFFPSNGYSLQKALRCRTSISVAAIARKPAN